MLEIGTHYYVKLSHVPRDALDIQGIAGDVMRVCAIEEFRIVHRNPSLAPRSGYVPVFKCNRFRSDPKGRHDCTPITQIDPKLVGWFPSENLTEMNSQHADFLRHLRETGSNRSSTPRASSASMLRSTLVSAPLSSTPNSPRARVSPRSPSASTNRSLSPRRVTIHASGDSASFSEETNDGILSSPREATHSHLPPSRSHSQSPPVASSHHTASPPPGGEAQVFQDALASSTLTQYTMAHSFSAEGRGELSVRAGETVVPLNSRLAKATDGWTLVLHVDSRSGVGHVGHVPTAFIRNHETISHQPPASATVAVQKEDITESVGLVTEMPVNNVKRSASPSLSPSLSLSKAAPEQETVKEASKGTATSTNANNSSPQLRAGASQYEALLSNPEDPVTLERLYNEIYKGAHETGYEEGFLQGRNQQSEYLLARLRGTLVALIDRAERSLTLPPESLVLDGTLATYTSSIDQALNLQLTDIFGRGSSGDAALAPPLLATPLLSARNRFQDSLNRRGPGTSSLLRTAANKNWTNPEYLSSMEENRVLITSYSRLLIELDEIEKDLGILSSNMSNSVQSALDRSTPRHNCAK